MTNEGTSANCCDGGTLLGVRSECRITQKHKTLPPSARGAFPREGGDSGEVIFSGRKKRKKQTKTGIGFHSHGDCRGGKEEIGDPGGLEKGLIPLLRGKQVGHGRVNYQATGEVFHDVEWGLKKLKEKGKTVARFILPDTRKKEYKVTESRSPGIPGGKGKDHRTGGNQGV